MKTCRKLLLLLLAVCLVLTLSGCGSFQTQMLKTATKMSRLQSFHADVNADAEILLDLSGQEVETNALLTGGIDVAFAPLKMKTALKLSVLGMEKDLNYTIFQDDDAVIVISGEGDESGRMVFQSGDADHISLPRLMKVLARCSEYFAEPVEDTVNGEDVRRYDGVLPQTLAEELMAMLIEDRESSDTEENGRFPVSIWINGDDRIVRVRTDLAVFLEQLVDEQMDAALEKYGLSGLEVEMDLKSVDTDIVLSQFDAVDTIVIPDAHE